MGGDKMYHAEANVLNSDFVSHSSKFNATFNLNTYLLRLQYEGSCFAVIQGERYLVETGNLLLFAPGDSYELIIECDPQDNEKTVPICDYYIYCEGSWVDQWWAKRSRNNNIKIALNESILGIWKQINLGIRKREENKELMDYLVRILCITLDQMILESINNKSQNKAFLVYRMKNFIEEHATETIHLKDVADYAGLSVSRTVALFKAIFGKTILQYTLEVRLSIAVKRVLFSKMTLEKIAETSGFGSYSYFYRTFISKYGISPNIYRERNGKL
jgi:AraC family transcriptional regulator of arabinose operon